MEEIKISHDAADIIVQKLISLEQKIDAIQQKNDEAVNEWMNIKELCLFLPNHPAQQTIYGWTSNNQIPFYKKGKNILFRKSEIENWLSLSDKRKSTQELEVEALEFIKLKK